MQRALANKLCEIVPLAHIARIRLPRTGRRQWIRSAVSVTLARGLRRAWLQLCHFYDVRYPEWPAISSSVHASANAPELAAIVRNERPDLILVSGTDLLTRATILAFGAKVMNLHTGLSPYIRGGPNCTNWALALGEFGLIGNTILWIDPGIDSGAIIASERTRLTGKESLSDLHLKVMEHAHDLYLRAVKAFADGKALPAVPQHSIAQGRLFLTRHWNGLAMVRATLNHRFGYRSHRPRDEMSLVALDSQEEG